MKFRWFLIRRAFWIGLLKLLCGKAYSDEVLYTCLLGKRVIGSNRGYVLFEDSTWVMKNEFFESESTHDEHLDLQRQLGIHLNTEPTV